MDTSISIKELEDQLEWEETCELRGIKKYLDKQEELKSNKKGELADITQILLRDRVVKLGSLLQETIDAKLARATRETYGRLVQLSAINYDNGEAVYDYNKVALIALKVSLKEVYRKDRIVTRTAVIAAIGLMLELDLKCLMFKHKYPVYYQKIDQTLADKNAMSYQQKLRVIQKKFKDFEMDWNDWTPNHRAGAGLMVFEMMMVVMHDVFRIVLRKIGTGYPKHYFETQESFLLWAGKTELDRAKLQGSLMPLKIQPRNWVEDNLENGVYYSQNNEVKVSLIKKKYDWDRKWINKYVPQAHMDALNILQSTKWRINTPVLKVQNHMFRNNLGGLPIKRTDLVQAFPEHLDKDKSLYTPEEKQEFGQWNET